MNRHNLKAHLLGRGGVGHLLGSRLARVNIRSGQDNHPLSIFHAGERQHLVPPELIDGLKPVTFQQALRQAESHGGISGVVAGSLVGNVAQQLLQEWRDARKERWRRERERRMGRPTIIDLREVINAPRYLTRTG